MKVIDHIRQANKTLFSFEILPPKKGDTIGSLFESIEPLMDFKPAFIDVTYHREEFYYREHDNGLLERTVRRHRPGTVGICAAVMNRFHVDTVPHIICGGFSKRETEEALIDLNFLGIESVLLLRGDAAPSEKSFVPHPDGNPYASDLIVQVADMNKGRYLDKEYQTGATDFCIGAAGYPEKHFEAPNLDCDLKYLKKKVELGAEYIVTQMFFNNQAYYDFVNKCRAIGIDVPIIPGLKPITSKRQLSVLASIFHIDMPQDLVTAVEQCTDKASIKQVGVEWCVEQSRQLMDFGVPCLHYYSMSRSEAVKRIATELF